MFSDDPLNTKNKVKLAYENQKFSNKFLPKINHKYIFSSIQAKQIYDKAKLFLKIDAYKSKDKKYLKVNELYYQYEHDNYSFSFGKDLRFWGSMELYNITDIYNRKNIKYFSYDKDKKLGSKNITYKRYLENEDELSVILKYDDKTCGFLQYSGSRDNYLSRDFSYILYISEDVKKLLTFHSIVNNNSIYKFEYLYNYNKNINDYYEVSFGVEHTIYEFFNNNDLGLIAEYYKNNKKIIQINNFNDDIFLAFRLHFNNIYSSEIIAGITRDYKTKQDTNSIEFKTRIKNNFTTKLSYVKDKNTNITLFSLTYHF